MQHIKREILTEQNRHINLAHITEENMYKREKLIEENRHINLAHITEKNMYKKRNINWRKQTH